MTENKRFMLDDAGEVIDLQTAKFIEYGEEIVECLNNLHEENQWLEINNKELVSFIKSKGYTLKDFLDYIGQFASVGVNKEDWND